MNLIGNVIEKLGAYGVSQREIARKIGISSAAVSSLKRGVTSPAQRTLRLLEIYFNVNPDYLRLDHDDPSVPMFGSGGPTSHREPGPGEILGPGPQGPENEQEFNDRVARERGAEAVVTPIPAGARAIPAELLELTIPLLGTIAAGEPIVIPDEYGAEYIKIAAGLLPDGQDGKRLFALQQNDNSMQNAGILSDDWVIVHPPNGERLWGEILCVRIDRKEMLVRRVFLKEDKYTLEAANPAYTAFFPEHSRVEVLGRVVGVIRFCR